MGLVLLSPKVPNTAMQLSRPRKIIFFAEHTLRLGDGKR